MKKFAVLTTLVLLSSTVLYFWPTTSLDWHEEDGFRWANLSLPWFGRVGFELLPASTTNITFSNNLSNELISSNQHLLNGSGVALGDVDNDGLTDIYLCQLEGPNILYRNLGDWKFSDITETAGVACSKVFSTGAAFADIDGDYDLDLLVTTLGGPNFCFENDGQGNFTDVTETAGLIGNSGATTMALADIDGDDDLDLYVANYKKETIRDQYLPQELVFDRVIKKVADGYEVIPKFRDQYEVWQEDNLLMRFENAEPDRLYLNDGAGHFQSVPFTDGRFLDEDGKPISQLKDWGLTARFQDMDGDGDPDIFVCNDFESPDRIWINDGRGHFRAIAKLALRNISWATMGVGFSDIDRDGDLDFFLLDMLSRDQQRRKTQKTNMLPIPHSVGAIDNRPQNSRNTLFLNRGDGTYAEIAQFSGLHASDWSWSPLFMDVDLDGYEDLIIATGHFYDALNLDALDRTSTTRYQSLDTWRSKLFQFPDLKTVNIAFRNRGDLTFEDVSQQWGFDEQDIAHGMASADLDSDGDLDLVINRLNAPVAIYRNESTAPRLAVRLRGLKPNTQGIGSIIEILGGPVPQSKEVICAGSYLSSSDPFYVFAPGENGAELTIRVRWRSGRVSIIQNVRANRTYEIDEAGAQDIKTTTPKSNPVTATPYFEDASHLLNHIHHENEHDDFRYQSLLPKKLSQLGPGVTWFDLDGDGDDDLFVGSGKKGRMAYFQNNGLGGFTQIEDPILTATAESDQTTILGWITSAGTRSLLVASTNQEDPSRKSSTILQYDIEDGAVKQKNELDTRIMSCGPMTMADYDADGDLDLFIGASAKPSRYPESAPSRLYKNNAGKFVEDVANNSKLREIGLVSGAVFSDIDGDGDADLILAIEWGPITIFTNEAGVFTNATSLLGLDSFPGWWQGVTTGDLDNDGNLDIIATNWGLNSRYQDRYDKDRPLQIIFDDFDNNGELDIVETYLSPVTNERLPARGLRQTRQAMPFIGKRFTSHKKYSEASVQEIIGFKAKNAPALTANTLAHTAFLNRGDHFEARLLPSEAQFAPAFYVGVADFDGDGHEDVFISQNFFSLEMGASRLDAGRGMWLKGDGTGELQPISGQRSGIKVYGEQRGAALSDYDGDARIDLVVSQNGAQTKLYHNVGAKPGLRVRLAGPAGNRNGIGATIRLVYGETFGPARQVHLGSGYWSQNSAIQVMGARDAATHIWVRWPGGKVTQTRLPENSLNITVYFND